MPLGHQQLVQPRGRQPLLAARPLRRLGQQRLHPRGRPRPTPAAAAAPPPPSARGAAWSRYLPDRDARQPQLAGHRPLRPPLHQHFVPNDMHLIHPEHPLQRTPDPSIRQARHQALRWSTFRAAIGLLSERRAHTRAKCTSAWQNVSPQTFDALLENPLYIGVIDCPECGVHGRRGDWSRSSQKRRSTSRKCHCHGRCREINISTGKLEGLFVDELARLQPTEGYMRLVKECVVQASGIGPNQM